MSTCAAPAWNRASALATRQSLYNGGQRRCPPMFWDPTFVLLLPAIVLAVYAQYKVQSTFRHYAQIRSGTGYTGAQVAAELLRMQGVTDGKIEPVQGMLAGPYDRRRQVRRVS